MRHIIPISGKDSLATALVQTARRPDLPYEFLFSDVSAELPETYSWLEQVESMTNWRIQRTGVSLPALIDKYGGFLPSTRARYCTRQAKIEPMEAFIGTEPATVYYGLRADENRIGYVPLGKSNIIPSYPLREMGIDLQGVYAILDAQHMEPPRFFWQRLFDAVAHSLKDWGDWENRLTRLERTALFAGRSRGNCFFCFFQRKYEFVWLFETHPRLFAEASAMEKADYTFQQGARLSDYFDAHFRERIFNKRVQDVAQYIRRKYQMSLFESLVVDNEIALTSCGLLCGK